MMLSRLPDGDASGTDAGERTARVVAWVLALPNGDAVLVPLATAATAPIVTTMDNVCARWARLLDAELAPVPPRYSLHLAA